MAAHKNGEEETPMTQLESGKAADPKGTLKYGMQGERVATLHRMLKAKGAKLEESGSFTMETVRAVRKWQHDLRLPETGLITPNDWALLEKS